MSTLELNKEAPQRRYRNLLSDLGPLLGLCVLTVVASIISPSFLTKQNITNVLNQVAVLGLGALGMTLVVISGYFDLSVAGMLSLANVGVVILQTRFGTLLAIVIMLLIGVLVGLVNGTILRVVRGDFGASIMITFGVGTILSSVALMSTNGFSIHAQEDALFSWFGYGRVLGISAPVVLLFVGAVVLHIVLRHTVFGRAIYLTGANFEAARLSGIPVYTIRMITFMISGFMVAVGALIESSQTVSASPVVGVGYELNVLAAVAIGGTSLMGGEGNIIRTIIGVLLMGVLDNIIILMGLTTSVQMMAEGVVIVAAIFLDRLKSARQLLGRP
ncbi:MAG: ABC transporter permease [Alicyclobacillaceae bacterium]|nr:ABC transporter permease [Alicyclobacillaceae bacterium]